MRQAPRTDEDLPLFDFDDLAALSVRLEHQLHLALDLVKKFITGVDMKIEPCVRPAKHHDQKIFMMDEKLICAEWRVKESFIFIAPPFLIICREPAHRKFLLSAARVEGCRHD